MTAPKTYSRTAVQIMEMISDYEIENPGGGVLHISTHDQNVSDYDIIWCHDLAARENDIGAVEICDLLLERGRSARHKICTAWWRLP